jgi:hypothetical protein
MQKIEFVEPLLQEYQYALLFSLKDPQRELNTAARKVGERFGGKGLQIKDLDEFSLLFADFLKNYLKMVETVFVDYNKDTHVLSVSIEGCKFCPANTQYKLETSEKAVCPLNGLVRGALKNVEGKMKTFKWLKTEKPPETVGVCTTTYELEIK